jgi:hypothetical protein
MEKKLTAQGPKTRKSYTVTLPIEWVKEEDLDKTKTVELTVVGKKVIISSSKDIKEMIHVNGEEYKNCLVKVLQGLYKVGVNEIKLSFENIKLVNVCSEMIEKLIGYEIITHSKNYLIIKDITGESEESFKVIFRRIFLLILEMLEIKNKIQLEAIDKNIDKLINYCQRILIKKGHVEFTKTPIYYLMLDRLEKIADELKWLGGSNKQEYKEISQIFRVAYELFYKYDTKRYHEYQYKSYILLRKVELGEKIDKHKLHMHNLARLTNSLYGEIFSLKFEN